MDTQWLLLGVAVVLTGLAVASVVGPGRLVRDNVAWSACGWAAEAFAPWLAAVALLLGTTIAAGSDGLPEGPDRLAALLAFAAGTGLVLASRRARDSSRTLEQSLRDALGDGYLGAVAPQRMAALADAVPPFVALQPIPRRPSCVELIADVPYPGGHARNVLDVYRPARGCQAAPVLLQLHGGAWTSGHKRQQALPLVHHLAALGWVVVTPNYRLGPEARMPAQLVDCKAALAWTRAHVASMGGDPSFIAVSGTGAGAHLATLLALTFDDPVLQPGFEHVDTRPAACIALHGVYDLADRQHRRPGRAAHLRWVGTNLMPASLPDDPAAWDAASPLAQLRHDIPPFFVLHGTHDALCHVDEAREFVRELRRFGAGPVAYAELPGAPHGWDTLRSTRALHTVGAITRFLEWCAARQKNRGHSPISQLHGK